SVLTVMGPISMTGCAAPAFVPGAIAATSADSRMKIPADPARLPVGATYTMTGTGEAGIFSIIARGEGTNPPGVFISMSTAEALRACASAIARPMYSSVIGWIVSLTTIFRTCAGATVLAVSRNQKAARTRIGRVANHGFISWAAAALSPRAW